MKGHLWSCFFTSLIPIGTALLPNVNSKISITTLVTRKRSILMIIMVLSKTVWDLSFGLKNKSLFSQKKRDCDAPRQLNTGKTKNYSLFVLKI